MKILNFGSMNIDYVYQINDFPKAGETILASSQSVNPGGKGLNQSIALAKAGAEIYHACAMGNGGEMLVNAMRSYGVDTSYIWPVDEVQGNASIYVNKNGENNIVLFGGSNRRLTIDKIKSTLDCFGEGDWLLTKYP